MEELREEIKQDKANTDQGVQAFGHVGVRCCTLTITG